MQRILRKPINWAVEYFFPDGCFYGDSDPMKTFERNDGETVGRAAVMVLIRHCNDNDALELKATFSGVTVKGADIGDWRVLVEKL